MTRDTKKTKPHTQADNNNNKELCKLVLAPSYCTAWLLILIHFGRFEMNHCTKRRALLQSTLNSSVSNCSLTP
eukprot:619410-Prorocentrum_minimum.AAC.2